MAVLLSSRRGEGVSEGGEGSEAWVDQAGSAFMWKQAGVHAAALCGFHCRGGVWARHTSDLHSHGGHPGSTPASAWHRGLSEYQLHNSKGGCLKASIRPVLPPMTGFQQGFTLSRGRD